MQPTPQPSRAIGKSWPEARPAVAFHNSPANGKNPRTKPIISIIVLNYNGVAWLNRCLSSLAAQTIADDLEVLVTDNASTDGSDLLAGERLRTQSGWRVIRYAENLGYCAGNNAAAKLAQGQYLLFLNHDTWLEPDCLERLFDEVRSSGAIAATPLVMDYQSDTMQSCGESGFDLFGLLSYPTNWAKRQEIFVATGPALLIQTDWFQKLGGFDAKFFMYADEYDLCWRVWRAGGKVILAPSARLHHRGAVAVNPNGGDEMVEIRTSDTKRFYANRNGLLVLLMNSQNLLLALVPLQLVLLITETLLLALWTRRFSHFRRAGWDAAWDCWRLRRHILAERRQRRNFRQHGDFWMLRFLRARLNRWREFRRCWRFGLPKVDSR